MKRQQENLILSFVSSLVRTMRTPRGTAIDCYS